MCRERPAPQVKYVLYDLHLIMNVPEVMYVRHDIGRGSVEVADRFPCQVIR